MKKINTIDYGGKVILIGLVFFAVLPVALYILNRFLNSCAVTIVMYVSIGIGVAIEIYFGCALYLELRQDRDINKFYENNPSSLKTPQQILEDSRWRKYHRVK